MKSLKGIPASQGVAIGPAFLYRPRAVEIDRSPISDDRVESELAELHRALEEARMQLEDLQAAAEETIGQSNAAILGAQALMLADPELLSLAENKIREERLPAPAALVDAAEFYAEQLAALDDEYLRARAVDVRDAAQRVLRILLHTQDNSLARLPRPVVVIAQDLTPSDTASMDRPNVLALCTARGGIASHTAILARAYGLPAVVGLGDELLEQVALDAQVVVDGNAGVLVVEPDEEAVQQAAASRAEWKAGVREAGREAAAPAITRDGRRVEVAANIGDVQSAQRAVEAGAEGVGLLRTEFLFLERQDLPGEEEQYQAYRAIAEVMGERPVIVRTLDVGGDKPPPYLDIGHEANPFLGWRALRISLDRPEMFKTQLRAILRAGVGHNLRIMFPMVISVDEVRAARQCLKQAQEELQARGIAYVPDMPVGIMVETPAAAILADRLAAEVDFVSLGTNDLTQYTLAVDRGNDRVAPLFDWLHPGVLRLIRFVIEGAHHAGKWAGMCGEMAGDPEAIPLLLGLGLDEFSMNASAIPPAKQLIRRLDTRELQPLAARACEMATAAEVRGLLREVVS